MGGFFSVDGAFYKYGGLLADMCVVSILWIVCCIPIVTIGPATAAAFYVMTRRISDKEKYVMRDFFTSFKRNFKTGALVNLTILGVAGILALNITNIESVGNMAAIILPFQFLFAVELAFVAIYIYPMLARFDMGYVQLFKSAFFMANRHLPTTVVFVVTLGATALLAYIMPIFFFIAPGTYALLTSYLFMRLFKKYRPEMDKDVDYEELHRQLLAERAAESGGADAEDERVFNDAAGLLIERQAKEADKKKGKKQK